MRWAVIVLCACAAPAKAPVIANATPPVPGAEPPAPPTVATAGVVMCRPDVAVVLGEHGGGDAAIGFGGARGIAAWQIGPTSIEVQAIAPDGTRIGMPATVTVHERVEPHEIYPIAAGFVVLLRLWDWEASDLNWWALVVDRDGHVVRPPVEIGLADLDIAMSQRFDDRTIALITMPGTISKQPTGPMRWQTLTIDASGKVTWNAHVIDTHGLEGEWQPADLHGMRGWLVVRNGARVADGIFDGQRRPSDGATPLADPAALDIRVVNAAEPPPPGPGGRIIEAMGRPMLHRTHAGQPVGEALALEWHGNPIAYAMNISTAIAWSGTHFLYPFSGEDGGPTHDRYVEALLPIDCRP